MAHIKTQMDFLPKYLLLGNMEKVKVVGYHSRVVEAYFEKEENYLNNHSVFGPVAQEIKIGTIKGRIIMTNIFIEIVTKEVGRINVIKVDCVCHLEAKII